MILSGRTLRDVIKIEPFVERSTFYGMSYGLGPAGYDIRIRERVELEPGGFMLGSSFEYMELPRDIVAFVIDKSTLARMGLSLFNTVAEPGWRGHWTLELSNRGPNKIVLPPSCPIAQVQFHRTDTWCDPYTGKYNDQGPYPQQAIFE